MTKQRTRTALALMAVIAVAVMIFLFSAQEGDDSGRLSGNVTEAVLRLLSPGFDQLPREARDALIARWVLFVRKAAHFSEFAMLAVTLVVYLHCRKPGRWGPMLALAAWGAAALYACTDEMHQMFVSERAAAITDVCIDAAGALIGALIAWGYLRLRSRRAEKHA